MFENLPVYDIISVNKDGWITCPVCGYDHLKRVRPDEAAELIYIHCRKCKNDIPIKLKQGESLKDQGRL